MLSIEPTNYISISLTTQRIRSREHDCPTSSYCVGCHIVKPILSAKVPAPVFQVIFLRGINGTSPILLDGTAQVAFLGRSNAGKSSTINALLSRVIAKTSARPGKTLEINLYDVMAGKAHFLACDLPGYGWSRVTGKGRDKLRKHIIWYLSESGARPTIALIVDAMIPPSDFDIEAVRVCKEEGHPIIIVANKIDRLNQKERISSLRLLADAFPDIEIFPSSAKTKEGIDIVRKRLFQLK
jgi:GTP-binding protein